MTFTMKLKPAEFIALSACTMLLTALAIDLMLPAFGELRDHFNLGPDSTGASQIVAFFFMGQIAQVIFGTLSDRYGRLAILRVGFPLYIGGGIAAAFAPSLGWMLAARFVAGMGASALFMITIAARDRFVGDKMARTMSLILTIFLFTPIVAPFLGTAILSVSSWQVVFLIPPLFALVIFLVNNKRSIMNIPCMESPQHQFPTCSRFSRRNAGSNWRRIELFPAIREGLKGDVESSGLVPQIGLFERGCNAGYHWPIV